MEDMSSCLGDESVLAGVCRSCRPRDVFGHHGQTISVAGLLGRVAATALLAGCWGWTYEQVLGLSV